MRPENNSKEEAKLLIAYLFCLQGLMLRRIIAIVFFSFLYSDPENSTREKQKNVRKFIYAGDKFEDVLMSQPTGNEA